jgi:serine/threonine-protein kinase
MSRSADRNLLFGLLALQNNFIDRDVLLDAFQRWVHDRAIPLGQILRDRGALRPDEHDLLQALVAKHLEKFDGDPQKSLQHLSSIGSLRQDLSQIADADLQASLRHVAATRPDEDPYRTVGGASLGAPSALGTRFRVLRPHARGGLGEVFLARDTQLNRDVALKEIQDRYADDPRYRTRFEYEAEVTGGLEHPGIVPVYGLGHTPDGRPFYAMRFIRGDSLKEAIRRFHQAEQQPGRDPSQSALELRELLGRFVDVCDAVAYAHCRGVPPRSAIPQGEARGARTPRFERGRSGRRGRTRSIHSARDDRPPPPHFPTLISARRRSAESSCSAP